VSDGASDDTRHVGNESISDHGLVRELSAWTTLTRFHQKARALEKKERIKACYVMGRDSASCERSDHLNLSAPIEPDQIKHWYLLYVRSEVPNVTSEGFQVPPMRM
jgi:hypothetical protein